MILQEYKYAWALPLLQTSLRAWMFPRRASESWDRVHHPPNCTSFFLALWTPKSFHWILDTFKTKDRAEIFAYKPLSSSSNKKVEIDVEELFAEKWFICFTQIHINSFHSQYNVPFSVAEQIKFALIITPESVSEDQNTAYWCIVSYVK